MLCFRHIVSGTLLMSAATVRQAVLADLDAITPLFDAYRRFYGRASDLPAAQEFLRARFNHGESVLLLALVDGKPAGFAQLYPAFSSVSLARTFILNDLYVAPDYRSNGVGAGLLRAASEYGRQLGAVRLTLSTAVDNATAQALYQSVGWQRDQQFYVYHYPLL